MSSSVRSVSPRVPTHSSLSGRIVRAAACALLGLLLVAGLPAAARAAAVATTVAVIDSAGAPLAGAQITCHGSSGSWQPVQVTGADGAVRPSLTAGSYTFQATWNGGSLQQTQTIDASHSAVTFQTLDVRVPVVDSQGAGIAGVVQNFYGSTGSWVGNRTTGTTGILHYELLAGTYRFQATYNGGSQQQALAVDPAHTSLTFTTLDVSVALLDSQDAGIAGGVQNFYGSTGSWVGNRTAAAGGVLHYELLAASMTARWPGGSATAKGARLVLKLPANVTAVDVSARDRAGNVGRVSLSVGADRVRPSLTVTAPALAFGPRATIKLTAPGARLLVDGRRTRGTAQVAAGRKHVVESVDKAGNRSRVAILIPRDRPIARLTSPALDGPRGDELWPGRRDESGVRRYLLRAAQQRLVIAGALPAKFRPTTRFTADVAAAVRAFQAANGIAASGKIDAPTKAALDRVATGTRVTWSGK